MEIDETNLKTKERANKIIEPVKGHETSMKDVKKKGKLLGAEENTGQQLDIEMWGCNDDPLDVIECEILEETSKKEAIDQPFKEEQVLNPSNDVINNEQDILEKQEFIKPETEDNFKFNEIKLHTGQPSLTKKASIWNHVYRLEGKTHCKYCEKRFKGKQARALHIKIHILDQHGERSEVQILKTQNQVMTDIIEIVDDTFICKVCDFVSDSKAEMNKHVSLHLVFYDKKKIKVSKVWNFAQKYDGFAKCNLFLQLVVVQLAL